VYTCIVHILISLGTYHAFEFWCSKDTISPTPISWMILILNKPTNPPVLKTNKEHEAEAIKYCSIWKFGWATGYCARCPLEWCIILFSLFSLIAHELLDDVGRHRNRIPTTKPYSTKDLRRGRFWRLAYLPFNLTPASRISRITSRLLEFWDRPRRAGIRRLTGREEKQSSTK